MNQYPLWKYLLILAIIVPGMLYALPNLYGEDPGIQVAGLRSYKADTETLKRIEGALSEAGIEWRKATLDDTGARIRFADTEQQLNAKDVVQDELGENYTVSLALLPATPEWLTALGGAPMYLGLDLRGGVHFLMEVDMDAALRRAEERYEADIKTALREAKIRYLEVSRQADGGLIRIASL